MPMNGADDPLATTAPTAFARCGHAAMRVLMIVGWLGCSAAGATAWHDHADIRTAAEARARTAVTTADGRIDVVANPIDARVRLEACERPLTTSIPYGNKQSPRVTVEVRCPGAKPWKLYVPVRTAVFRQVVIASRPLTRGSILTPDDIILAEFDTGLLPRGYIVAGTQAVGRKVRRAVKTGDPITPALLEIPTTIRRGQKVSLEARSGALTVRMVGIAQSDGILGEVIEFENTTSKRSVQAIVRSPQSAEILIR